MIAQADSSLQNKCGLTGFFVDAKNEEVKKFYSGFGFIPLKDEQLKLFLPLGTLAKGLERALTERS